MWIWRRRKKLECEIPHLKQPNTNLLFRLVSKNEEVLKTKLTSGAPRIMHQHLPSTTTMLHAVPSKMVYTPSKNSLVKLVACLPKKGSVLRKTLLSSRVRRITQHKKPSITKTLHADP